MGQYQDDLLKILSDVVQDNQTEILVYSGPLIRPHDDTIIRGHYHQKKKRIILLLATYGGNADAAYRIARCLKEHFESFSVFVPVICKSAGTLLALGANEIIMSDRAEIGPLDVQVLKTDELGERSSGLTITQALGSLQSQAFSMFEEYLLDLRFKSGYQISTARAMDVASQLTVGLFAPIYGQIDPMRVGEIHRANMVAMEYGQRIGKDNLKEKSLEKLVAGYPAHGFVIDRTEAKELFKNVRSPSEQEEALGNHIQGWMMECVSKEEPLIFNLTDWYFSEKAKKEVAQNEQRDNEKIGDNKTGEHEEKRLPDKRDDEKFLKKRVARKKQ